MGYIADSKKKFEQLPANIKDKLKSPEAINAINGIEKKFDVKLNSLIILVAIGEISVFDIAIYFQKRFNISVDKSKQIEDEIISQVLSLTLTEEEKLAIKSEQIGITIEEIRKIFQENIIKTLLEDADRINKINQIVIGELLNESLLSARDLLKDLNENQEIVSDSNIIIEDKKIKSTVSNWIKDYIRQEGSNEDSFDGMKISRYVTNSVNGRALNSHEKTLISKLLKLYKQLKFFPASLGNGPVDSWQIMPLDTSSLSPKARTIKSVTESFEQVAMNDKKVTLLELLKEKYNKYRRNRWNILRFEDEILVKTRGEIELLKKELSVATRQSQSDRVIASIKILARQNNLVKAIQTSPAWIKALGENIVSKYSSQNEPSVISVIVSQLKENISSPALVSEFLQYLLKDKLKMSENDSALVATEIGQLLGENYQIMVFGNQTTGNFEWSKIKILNQKLVIDIY